MSDLLKRPVSVLNIGLDEFVSPIEQHGGEVLSVDWSPSADVDEELLKSLTTLAKYGERIDAANQRAVEQIRQTEPFWTDVLTAVDVLDGMDDHTLLHSGPPVSWESMSGPQRGAVIGALQYEGLAESVSEAETLAASGEITFEPCHHHGVVGPMAGVVSPSMPLMKVKNRHGGNVAYSNLNEGLGTVLRFGAYSDDVIEHLVWMEQTLAPVLRRAVRDCDGVDLKLHSAKALQMGDEVHNRNVAGTALLIRTLAPAITTGAESSDGAAVLEFLGGNEHFYLNLSMAACKVAADAASGIPWSTVVTAMARNGTEFGIRVSGLDDQWFTTDAPVVEGLFFSGYSASDASPDIGDSSIAETMGMGGFAMAASPAITQFVGGTPAEAVTYSREMREITVTDNPNYTLPALDFNGTPTGIDLLRVLDSGVHPVINTGIAHREPGVGQIGAGVGRAPQEPFLDAAHAFCAKYV